MRKEFKKIIVDSEWIKKNTTKAGWQRNLYPARVNHFVNHIQNGTFKPSLVTVAKKGEKLVILDGQHKLEAIIKAGVKQEMDLIVYHNLSDDEMIEIYKMLNNVKQPRLIDDIKIHVGKKKWLDCYMDSKRFPINVTLNGGINSLRIDNLLNVISNGLRSELSRINLNRRKIDSFIENLDELTYLTMCDFCRFYRRCFGDPSKDNWLYRNVIMFTILRIWRNNKGFFKEDEMVKSIKPIETNDTIRRELGSSYDRNSLETITRKIYNVINFRRSANKFVIFWDEDILI